ncbi:SDR family oxidoreductase [Paenibacillus sp. NPDC058174]|uniref:SDR family oxidoreductase n=1 Tax=Paenibacillus sp. NPDC058174 TaxID=3346366 RepID=UPI0036DBAA12
MTAKTWFITGINSGFGRQLTEQLLERGDYVAGTIRKLDAVDDLKQKYGARLWTAHLDVTESTEVHEVVNKAFTALGKIDVVVNNAGYGLFGTAEELTDELLHNQINTNLIGSIQVVRAALPHLRRQGGGRILQLSTYGGQAVNPGAGMYHATKWGIEGFMESTALDVAPFNIGITIVEPGGARTEFRYGSAKITPKNEAYEISPANMTRQFIEGAPSLSLGDPVKMAKAMIDSVDQQPAPKRLVLGSDSYRAIHKALTERLAELELQKDTSAATDFIE